MRRPSISRRVRRGLRSIIPVIDTNLDLYDAGDFASLTIEELNNIERALKYIKDLVDWHQGRDPNHKD